MPALTKQVPRFLKMRDSQNGAWGYLQRMFGGLGIKGTGIVGTVVVGAAATTVVVTDPGVQATDLIIVIPQGVPTNACYYTGYSALVAGTGYTLNVNTAPGASTLSLLVIRIPGGLLFGS